MRYLPISLSGEYFILPFKYHFHTKRGLCPAVVLPAPFTAEYLCFRQADNLFGHFRRALHQRMQIMILNCYQQGAHEKGMKPNCGHLA